MFFVLRLIVLQFCCFDFNKPLLEIMAYFLSGHFKSNNILFTIHTCFESESEVNNHFLNLFDLHRLESFRFSFLQFVMILISSFS